MEVKGKIIACIGLVIILITLLSLTPTIVDVVNQAMVSRERIWLPYEDFYDGDITNMTALASYATVHNALTGTVDADDQAIYFGQDRDPNNGGFDFTIMRAFVVFNIDEEGLIEFIGIKIGEDPANIEYIRIVDAYLQLNLTTDSSTTDFLITMQHNATVLIPNVPLQASNYWYHNWGSNHGQFNTSSLPAVFNTFDVDINSLGVAWIMDCIDEGEYVTWCLRSSRDIASTSPTGLELIGVEADDLAGDAPPTLYVLVEYEAFGHWTFTGAAGAMAMLGLVPFVWVAGVLLTMVVGIMAIARSKE